MDLETTGRLYQSSILKEKAQFCKQWFKACLACTALEDDDWLEQKSAEFNWWAAGLHAEKRGPGSLDARLRLRPDIRDAVADVLNGLTTALSRHYEIAIDQLRDENSPKIAEAEGPFLVPDEAERTPSPWSDMNDSSGSESDCGPSTVDQPVNQPTKMDSRREVLFQEQRAYIEANLTVLIRIYVAIRRSGLRFRNQRADDTLKQAEEEFQQQKIALGEYKALEGNSGEHERFKRYLTKLVLWNSYTENFLQRMGGKIDSLVHQLHKKTLAEDEQTQIRIQIRDQRALLIILRAYYYDPSRLTTVQHRLIHANVVRRNRLIYAGNAVRPPRKKETYSKPLPVMPVATELQPMVTEKFPAADTPLRPRTRLLSMTKHDKDESKGGDSFLAQPATALESTFSITGALAPTRTAKSAATKMSARVGHLSYPKCPVEQGSFPCPYCAIILTEEYTNKSKWRAHVAQDLCAYVCIFEDCESPDEMFASTAEWMSHMAKFHCEMERVCSTCAKSPGSTAVFEQPAQLREHILVSHPSTDLSDIDLLVGAGKRVVGIQRVGCPLCRPGLVTLEGENDEDEDDENGHLIFPGSSTGPATGLVQLEEDEHIATHLHEFALQAFPELEKETANSAESLSLASTSTREQITFEGPRNEMSPDDRGFMYTFDEICSILDELSGDIEIKISQRESRAFETWLDIWKERVHTVVINRLKRLEAHADLDAVALALLESRRAISQLNSSKNKIIDLTRDEDEAEDDPKYCLCQRVSFGEMIACDNDDCPYEWFHLPCVGLKSAPKGNWTCPVCTEKMKGSGNGPGSGGSVPAMTSDQQETREILDELDDHIKNIHSILDAAELSKRTSIPLTRHRIRKEYKPTHILPPCNPNFVGRDDILGKLEDIVFVEKSPVTAIFGVGGVGKTQVALQFAHRVAKRHSEFSVFWISAQTSEDYQKSRLDLANAIPIPKQSRTGGDIDPDESIRQFLSSEETGKWLIVIDGQGMTEDTILKSNMGRILFTVQSEEKAASIADTVLELRGMNSQEAQELFERKLARKDVASYSATMDLLYEIRYLPREIIKAAEYLSTTGATVNEYMGRLRHIAADTMDPNDRWIYAVDNDFPNRVFDKINMADVQPSPSEPAKLCSRCRSLDLWCSYFNTDATMEELIERSKLCDLCALFTWALQKSGTISDEKIRFYRDGSSFKLTPDDWPLLSIFTTTPARNIPSDIQRGLPQLPPAGSETQFLILQEWLTACDNHHCIPPLDIKLPVRLIDVGDANNPGVLRLDCSSSRTSSRYLAFSSFFANRHPSLSLVQSNMEQLQKQIVFDVLSQPLQDAITITRNLGIRYLWVDILCILHDVHPDEKTEKEMKDAFSFAYCTITAHACARNRGLFQPRQPRRCVRIDSTVSRQSSFYVTDFVDYFSTDMRAADGLFSTVWGFHDHIFSRRFVHFNGTQMYMECGRGVCCETLTNMTKLKWSFFSDPIFPQSALEYYGEMSYRVFQITNEYYSTLAHSTKRIYALLAVEEHILSAYQTQKNFSFSDYFHRNLLWKQCEPQNNRSGDNNKPSWLWTSVNGIIKYLEIPHGSIDWSHQVSIPSAQRFFVGGISDKEIAAISRPIPFLIENDSAEIFLDITNEAQHERPRQWWRCVVVATEKEEFTIDTQKCYVLLICPDSTTRANDHFFDRVGVAILKKDMIDFDKKRERKVVIV